MINSSVLKALDPAYAKPGSFLLAPGAKRSPYLAISHQSEIAIVPLNKKEPRAFVVHPIAKGLGSFLIVSAVSLLIDTDEISSAISTDIRPGQVFVYGDYKGFVVKSGYGTALVTTEGQYLQQPDWAGLLLFERWSFVALREDGSELDLYISSI